MRCKQLIIFAFSLLLTATSVFAQGICMKFTAENHINDIAVDGEYLWIATDNGAVKFNTVDNTHEQLTTEDGLLDNYITSITVDSKGVIWFGTYEGISTYNGTDWIHYTEDDENGPLSNLITDIIEDNDGNMWFGTVGSGVLKFDGTTWERYSTFNGLANAYVNSLALESNGTIWYGTLEGTSSYDGSEFVKYTTLEGNEFSNIETVAVDNDNVKWFGTYGGGISSFDGTDWKNYTVEDGLPGDYINVIASDNNGIKWAGVVGEGLASYDNIRWTIYTEVDGVSISDVRAIAVDGENVKWIGTSDGNILRFDLQIEVEVEEQSVPPEFSLAGAYPNPFNPVTTIDYTLPEDMYLTLKIYNVSGQIVSVLKDGFQKAGKHSVTWNAKGMPSGTYFYSLNSGGHKETKKIMLIK